MSDARETAITAMAEAMPMLQRLEIACSTIGAKGVSLIIHGVLHEVACMVEAETLADDPAHILAASIERLDDGLSRHKEFVRQLRRHLDGFLGDLPINPSGLRKAMEDQGV